MMKSHEYFGIAYPYVEEILHQVPISKPPCVPNFIAGVINWRGSLITVVDLMKFFHADSLEQPGEFIIVINTNTINLGLLCTSIEGSSYDELMKVGLPLVSAPGISSNYVLGLDREKTAILNVDTLVSSLSQEVKKNTYKIRDTHGNG
jgi:purine-binding chemotaxis protein CheW